MRLGELLTTTGKVSGADLATALAAQERRGGRLGSSLIDLGLVSERDVAEALGILHQIPFAAGALIPQAAALALISPEQADALEILPMKIEPRRVLVAVAGPPALTQLDAIAFRAGRRAVPVVLPERLLHQLLRRYCGSLRLPPDPLEPIPEPASRGPDLLSEEDFDALYVRPRLN